MKINMLPQPNELTCGPTCLHSIYRYYRHDVDLDHVIEECKSLDEGGTLDVFLACHALRSGFKTRIYTYNLQLFDPSWFSPPHSKTPGRMKTILVDRLRRQQAYKEDSKLSIATEGYLEYLRLGGEVYFLEMNVALIKQFLTGNIPILTGLCATYLYQGRREYGPQCEYDDIRGEPSGHFVVLNAYDQERDEVHIVDPLLSNPMAAGQKYWVNTERVLGAIFLGAITYDANLLIIEQAQQ